MFLTSLLLVLLLVLVFLSSRLTTQSLFRLFLGLTRSRFWAVQLLAWIFLPGTLVHELSHLIMAELLRVKTGQINLLPQVDQEEDQVKLGTVGVARSDPFRQTLIGIAPLVSGLASLAMVVFFLNQQRSFTLLMLGLFFLIFIFANTMFSSAKDLEAAAIPAIIAFLVASSLWLGKVKLPIPITTLDSLESLLTRLNWALGLTLGVNLAIWLVLRLVFGIVRFRGLRRD